MIFVSSNGEITLNIVTYLSKDFKTFSIKLDSNTLGLMQSQNFDFDNVDFVDISKKIKKSLKNPRPKILAYLVDKIDDIPD